MAELREIHQLQLEGNGMPRLGTDLEKENYTIAAQQRKYMKKSRRNIYVALEDLDLLFDESEVIRFQEMWEEDKSFIEIAVELGRHQLEIASLIMDQADRGMKQLTLEDVVGSFDYTATSTAEIFLKRNSVMTYSVEFYDRDEKWKLRWFEAKSEGAAIEMAKRKYGKIQIITTYISDRTLEEIMNLD
jgi:mannose/cellobiose epimerase-like protein (N-acyl-D-glucosamine 2-epimerase family)